MSVEVKSGGESDVLRKMVRKKEEDQGRLIERVLETVM